MKTLSQVGRRRGYIGWPAVLIGLILSTGVVGGFVLFRDQDGNPVEPVSRFDEINDQLWAIRAQAKQLVSQPRVWVDKEHTGATPGSVQLQPDGARTQVIEQNELVRGPVAAPSDFRPVDAPPPLRPRFTGPFAGGPEIVVPGVAPPPDNRVTPATPSLPTAQDAPQNVVVPVTPQVPPPTPAPGRAPPPDNNPPGGVPKVE